jgi:hypothetical protein
MVYPRRMRWRARRLPVAGHEVLEMVSGGSVLSPRVIDQLHRMRHSEPVQPRYGESEEQREEYWRRERARRRLESWSA